MEYIQYTWYKIHYTLYIIHYTIYNIQYTIYILQKKTAIKLDAIHRRSRTTLVGRRTRRSYNIGRALHIVSAILLRIRSYGRKDDGVRCRSTIKTNNSLSNANHPLQVSCKRLSAIAFFNYYNQLQLQLQLQQQLHLQQQLQQQLQLQQRHKGQAWEAYVMKRISICTNGLHSTLSIRHKCPYCCSVEWVLWKVKIGKNRQKAIEK